MIFLNRLLFKTNKQQKMSYSTEHYLKKFQFAPRPTHKNFCIVIDEDNKKIKSYVRNKLQNTLPLKINNESHIKLCMMLLVHLDAFNLVSKLNIRELKMCEKKYDDDMFMKEKKNILGFNIGIQNKNKKFAIKHFEEWKINSQDSSDKILEMIEEGDLYDDKPATIGFTNPITLENSSMPVEEENTYVKIQEANKIQYDEMNDLIQICNICGYWKKKKKKKKNLFSNMIIV